MWKYHFMNEASPQEDSLKQCSYLHSFYSTCIWAIRNNMRRENQNLPLSQTIKLNSGTQCSRPAT